MGFDFNSVRQQLHISESQFRQLDKLDGKEDGRLEESIFNCAKQIRNGDPHTNQSSVDVNLWQKVSDVLQQSVTNWLKPNLEKYSEKDISAGKSVVVTVEGEENVLTNAGLRNFGLKYKNLAIEAFKHYQKYGNFDSFTSQSFGDSSVNSAISFDVEFDYSDTNNDIIHNKRTDRTADGAWLVINMLTDDGEPCAFKQYFRFDTVQGIEESNNPS